MSFQQPNKEAVCVECDREFVSKLVFGKWVSRCNECKTPFNSDVYKMKQRQEENRSRWIKEHNCSKSGCMSVCTAFDY